MIIKKTKHLKQNKEREKNKNEVLAMYTLYQSVRKKGSFMK